MASISEIRDLLESLATHCRPPLMSPEERSRWLADWCTDLSEFPTESVKIACQRWRTGTSTKFPTPGQFLPLVRSVTSLGPQSATPQAWAPISDEAYEVLTLREKIRHQEILASEASMKAGPMWSRSGAVHPDDMPSAHFRWREIADNHRAEAKRLREKLKTFVGEAA